MTQFIVGLTGGIGSGKTKVSDRLGQLGATVVDTDSIAHQLTAAGGAAITEIKNHFGPESIAADGSMHRDFMREQITQNESARQELEAILHPKIRQEARRQIDQAASSYVLVVVPLLVEKGGWSNWMHEIVVIDCPVCLQIQRVEQRNGWPKSQIQKVLGLQASREERLQIATEVITNDGSEADLSEKIDLLHKKLEEKANKFSKNLHQNHR